MGSSAEIAVVRRNTNEPNQDNYSDSELSDKIDTDGVFGAVSAVWREKAAKFASLVDVSEAGASHKYSDLYKHALAMASDYDKLNEVENAGIALNSPRVKKIVRT